MVALLVLFLSLVIFSLPFLRVCEFVLGVSVSLYVLCCVVFLFCVVPCRY